METRIRIYIADMGEFRDPSKYEFIAEFADENLASNYVYYMRGKKRWRKKDIIVREEKVSIETEFVKTLAVISVLGESLELSEWGIV